MPDLFSRRGFLKEATDHLHRELDSTVSSYDLKRADHYAAFLQASATALLAIESLLEAAGVARLLPDWPSRQRGSLLMDDLRRLDCDADVPELHRASPTTSEMFGMLYVIEGSRLGARWLYARVCSLEDSRLHGARAYLHAHDPALWRSFLAQLESPPEPIDPDDLLAGAQYAFRLFQHSFAAYAPAPAEA